MYFCCVFLIILALPYRISLGQFLTLEVLWTHTKLLFHYKDFLNDQCVLSPKTRKTQSLIDFKSISVLSYKYLPHISIQSTDFAEQ